MENVTIFANRLKELRGNRTLQEVADEIGITRVALGYYEKGERKPDIEILHRLAAYYHVSCDYLLGLSDIKTPDISIKEISEKTGLSEQAIKKLSFYNTSPNFRRCIDALNFMFCSQYFENALYHIPDYIEKVKIDEILRGKRRDRQHEIENLYSEQDPNEAYNYPFADDLDKNYTENAEAMQLQEYIVDKNFRYIIQELERISRKEQSNSKS